jgi:hypothetical protein
MLSVCRLILTLNSNNSDSSFFTAVQLYWNGETILKISRRDTWMGRCPHDSTSKLQGAIALGSFLILESWLLCELRGSV